MRKMISLETVDFGSIINKWNRTHSLKRECGNRQVVGRLVFERDDKLKVCYKNEKIDVFITHFEDEFDKVWARQSVGMEDISISSIPEWMAKDLKKIFAIHMEKVGFYL